MTPLIDGDILRYEIGFGAVTGWKHRMVEEGGDVDSPPPWSYVQAMFDSRVGYICATVEATKPPIFYLTGKGNFRNDIAKKRPYKERPSDKPWHFDNLTAYIKGMHDYRESTGMEADDLMAIEQTLRPNETIICSRDKDLRQVAGWHFGWELNKQPQFGPILVDDFGWIELDETSRVKKIKGAGEVFFYSQILTGDVVDTIPGLPRCGPAKAFKILGEATTKEEALEAVTEAYKASYGDEWEAELLEQGQLLYMTRTLTEEGEPVLWTIR